MLISLQNFFCPFGFFDGFVLKKLQLIVVVSGSSLQLYGSKISYAIF
jgi:hypothetical protein